MRRIGYDRQHATHLIPLLRSILCEIWERSTAIAQLETHLEELPSREKSSDFHDLEARLAANRRELRLAKKELASLGCVLDENHPMRVHIPGNSGESDNGYTWETDHETACANAPESLAK